MSSSTPSITVATWNVNSITARLDAALLWLDAHRPDVLCLQETKIPDEKFPHAAFESLGYRVAASGQKAYNGVAIVSRLPLDAVHTGLPGDEGDQQKRLIGATVAGIRILNLYVPNGSEVGSEKFAYKLAWLARLRACLDVDFRPEEALLLCGDFNIAPEARDVYDENAVAGKVLYHPDEHRALATVRDWGLVDAFRLHQPDGGLFSWWDYRAGSFRRNLGMRIDHIWVSTPLAGRCTASWIDAAPRKLERPSDHVPVLATFSTQG
jgi:exodeoxyribonuclease-3